MARNLRSDLVALARYLLGRAPKTLRWVEGKRADGTSAVVLELADQIPRPPFRRRGPLRLQITSKHQRLRASRFGEAASAINEVGAKGHGRTLTCLDAGAKEPLAVVAFHLDRDPTVVILVTAIAVLNTQGSPAEMELSRAAAAILLRYLSDAALERGLPPRLGFAPPPNETELADRLGFRRAGPPAAYAGAGSRYREWSPPGPSP